MEMLLALACWTQVVVMTPKMGEPFSLGVGESAILEDADLSLTFSAVTRDSRCPPDVNCVVAGEAVVVFEAESGGEWAELTFEIPPRGGDERDFGDFKIAITELEPPTESGKRLEPTSYVATVLVREIVSEPLEDAGFTAPVP